MSLEFLSPAWLIVSNAIHGFNCTEHGSLLEEHLGIVEENDGAVEQRYEAELGCCDFKCSNVR